MDVSLPPMPPALIEVSSETSRKPLIFVEEAGGLIFYDEFNTNGALDGKWARTYFWGGRTLPSNREEQIYTDQQFLHVKQVDRPDSAVIEEGHLTLRADRLTEAEATKVGGKYASGLVTTYNSFAFRYGIIEIRAQAPKGKGFWSALWLLRKDKGSMGEIDIMEVLGDKPDFLNVTLHMHEQGAARINRFVRTKGDDLTAAFHVYTLLWSEQEIAFALNGVEMARTRTPDALKADMYLLMNLAVGGKWPGSPDAATPFPATFKIDYVRIWQMAGDKRP